MLSRCGRQRHRGECCPQRARRRTRCGQRMPLCCSCQSSTCPVATRAIRKERPTAAGTEPEGTRLRKPGNLSVEGVGRVDVVPDVEAALVVPCHQSRVALSSGIHAARCGWRTLGRCCAGLLGDQSPCSQRASRRSRVCRVRAC